ncbi:MAG: hypothetical protein ACYTG1_06255 [Planctomycetota bacterium]
MSRTKVILSGAATAALLAIPATRLALAGVPMGPDITCSRVGANASGAEGSNIVHWGDAGGIAAYSIATTSCNVGDQTHPWVAGGAAGQIAHHPVISPNFFRIENDRFEQIGMGWLKHSFCAVSEPTCGSCQSTGCETLGIGCADTYNASVNGGNNSALGPRSNVNPASGEHLHPYPAPAGDPTTKGRIQVAIADIDPALHPGARWYMEGQYIGLEDSMFGNQFNNVSHREFSMPGDWTLLLATGATQQEQPAIMAWQTVSGAAIESFTVDGRFLLGHLATDNGDGTWHYEYALYNMNSDRAAGRFSVPVPECAILSNVGFRDIDYHGGDGEGLPGENYDGTDWSWGRAGDTLTWSTEDWSTDANANALRWGTVYNFRFDADAPPTPVTATMGLFKPGAPTSVAVAATGPAAAPPTCPEDCHRPQAPTDCPDGQVDVSDLLAVLAQWGQTAACDIDGSGTVEVGDLLAVLGTWGACE